MMSDKEILTKLLKWKKWKRFKWTFYSQKKRMRIIKANVEIDVKAREDEKGNYYIDWVIKKQSENKKKD